MQRMFQWETYFQQRFGDTVALAVLPSAHFELNFTRWWNKNCFASVRSAEPHENLCLACYFLIDRLLNIRP